MIRHPIASALTILVLVCTAKAFSQRRPPLNAARVPLFQIRVRVTSAGGHSPSTQLFTYKLGKYAVKARGSQWSPWLDFTSSDAVKALRAYSNKARHRFPVVLSLQVVPVIDPTLVDAEVRLQGTNRAIDLHGNLFGPRLGIMLWRDANTGAPKIATMAGYNQRYWHEFDAAALRPSERPKHFLLVDRFIGGDDDRLDWQEGISHVSETGITAMLVPPIAALRSMLFKNGLRRIALGAGIAGGPLGFGSNTSQLRKWSSDFASRYLKAGYERSDFRLFALADEPGWYYPSALEAVEKHPVLLQAFRKYLATQHLSPAMLGSTTWGEVYPIGHSKVSRTAPLSTRRLFYWTCRFFPWYAAEHMRQGTEQLHDALTPQLKTFSNWNNFAGQFYFEGFPANNPNPHSPDAAMGSVDWFESGRVHATDRLWTEDWFGNSRAYQWSFYAAKLRSIAYKNALQFGGYVVPQVAGEPMNGLIRRILSLVGSGAKAVFYYNFGPSYNFPGNSYSEVPGVPAQLAQADRMIAKAEDVLWPGRQPQAQVAILQPRSAEVWDGLHIRNGSRIVGAAGNNLNGQNLDYMVEVFDEYLALQMSNIPTDFMSEDGLTDGTLNKYKVLYITEPDIPAKGQRAIAQWVRSGGTLAIVPGAAQGDRYDEPAKILTSLAGSPRHQRVYRPYVLVVPQTEVIGNAPVLGPPEPARGGKVLSSFKNHAPAVSQVPLGNGRIIYYSYFPGLSYGHAAIDLHLSLRKTANAEFLRNLLLTPVQKAGVKPPVQVSTSYIETPLLISSTGAAITFLNWTGRDLPSLQVTVHVPFQIARAASVTHGPIKWRQQGNAATFSIPLGAADVVKLTR